MHICIRIIIQGRWIIMTNGELIEKLKKLPLDLEVYDWNYYIVEEPIIRDIEVPGKAPDEYETKTVVFLP